jgi:hypothetical protein
MFPKIVPAGVLGIEKSDAVTLDTATSNDREQERRFTPRDFPVAPSAKRQEFWIAQKASMQKKRAAHSVCVASWTSPRRAWGGWTTILMLRERMATRRH